MEIVSFGGGELGSRAGVCCLKEMETPEFERLAEGLPGIHPEASSDLLEYKTCIKVFKSHVYAGLYSSLQEWWWWKRLQYQEMFVLKKVLEGCWGVQ